MNRNRAAIWTSLDDLDHFSEHVVNHPLRPYQLEAGRAILQSIRQKQGFAIAVMVSRQGGKNELSAQLEAYLLTLFQVAGGTIVKAAPTFKPQVITSKLRLESTLDNPLTRGKARSEYGYHVVLGHARCIFFSAEPSARVVGATASIALEFDEAQDIGLEKHDKDFSPMGASTNATRVYYGTAWDDRTLLARVIATNREAEARDGIRRNFIYPYTVVGEHNPTYAAYAEAERDRLGESHPLFKTQYRLEEISGEAGLFNSSQRARMIGEHPNLIAPVPGETYVAGVDVAGTDEAPATVGAAPSGRPIHSKRDATVITIGRVLRDEIADQRRPEGYGATESRIEIVAHYAWTGGSHREQYPRMLETLRDLWACRYIVTDATGIGAGVSEFLQHTLGEERVETFLFTAPSKSRLGFELLTAVNGNRLKTYLPQSDEAREHAREFWHQLERARYQARPNSQISFSVDERDGHDDYLMSLALLVRAAASVRRPPAAEIIPSRPMYAGEGGF